MAPAMEWVENYISESRLLAANVKVFDPTVGHLLAFGTAIGHRNRTINMAAYARGDVGSDLGMIPVSFATGICLTQANI